MWFFSQLNQSPKPGEDVLLFNFSQVPYANPSEAVQEVPAFKFLESLCQDGDSDGFAIRRAVSFFPLLALGLQSYLLRRYLDPYLLRRYLEP